MSETFEVYYADGDGRVRAARGTLHQATPGERAEFFVQRDGGWQMAEEGEFSRDFKKTQRRALDLLSQAITWHENELRYHEGKVEEIRALLPALRERELALGTELGITVRR